MHANQKFPWNKIALVLLASSGISACGGRDEPAANPATGTNTGTNNTVTAPPPDSSNPPAAQAPDTTTPDTTPAGGNASTPTPAAPAPASPAPAAQLTGAASDCLNRNIFATQSEVKMTARLTSGADTSIYTSSIKTEPNVSTPFGTMTQWQGTAEFDGDSVDLTFYLRVVGNLLEEYGFEATLNGSDLGQYELNHVDPRYDLALNESRASDKTTPIGTTTTITYTYVGQEGVLVPAGTFTACRFELDYDIGFEVPGIDSGDTEWMSVGSGLPVKSIRRSLDGDEVTELESASINGQPVIPQ